MNRTLLVACLAVLACALSVPSAFAGGAGGYPCGENCPTISPNVAPQQTWDNPIVAPRGLYRSFKHALKLVNAKCDADNAMVDPSAQWAAYEHHKRSLDRRLARKGFNPSPYFDEWKLSGFLLANERVVHSRCNGVG